MAVHRELTVPGDLLQRGLLEHDRVVDVGREGREGKPVGTLFVVGDHRKVLSFMLNRIFAAALGLPTKDMSSGFRLYRRAALAGQHAELAALLDMLDDAGWASPTRCEGWDVADTYAVLANLDHTEEFFKAAQMTLGAFSD